MGGNALRLVGVETRRLSAAEFVTTEAEAVKIVRACFPNRRVETIPAYAQKPDFGDVDILLEAGGGAEGLDDGWPERMAAAFGSRGFYRSKVVGCAEASFDFNGFQVDIVLAGANAIDHTRKYYSYNDLGNMIGCVAKAAGFKVGFKGMFLELRDGTEFVGDVLVSRDWEREMEFFGFDSKRWSKGFETREDIWDFVAQGRAYSFAAYSFEGKNNDARTRDRKRPMYSNLVSRLEGLGLPDGPLAQRTPDEWMRLSLLEFEGFGERLAGERKRHSDDALARRAFCGEAFGRASGLSGKGLGDFARWARGELGREQMVSAATLGAAEVDERLSSLFERYKDEGVLKEGAGQVLARPRV